MADKTAVVIGAGVVGCATAYELSHSGFEVIVLEKNSRIADETTSRNSGVIHAGLYYTPGSLKAETCIRGKALLYEWCENHGVSHKQTGKWVVAQDDEEEDLQNIFHNALACGATGLQFKKIKPGEIPGVRASFAIYSAETGIVDPYEYSKSFMVAAESCGAQFLTECEVTQIERLGDGFKLYTSRGEIEAEIVINSGGLYADDIAKMAGLNRYKVFPWRGNYFTLNSKYPYKQLIYPVKKKNAAGLGVHLTLALDGSMKLGPDVEVANSKNDYAFPANVAEKKAAFFASASKYLEGLTIDQLSYDTCGIRPKLRSPEDKSEKDFSISEDLPGFINLLGIESPGLTASQDIAQRVLQILK